MKTIDITEIISQDLTSRLRVQDLELFIENTHESEIVLDFQNVRFATRSFIDEFFKQFLKTPSNNSFTISLVNIPEDINLMIESVSRTQTGVKTIPACFNEIKLNNLREAEECFSRLSF